MSDSVDNFLALYDSKVRELALQVRELVYLVIPDAVENVQTGWKHIGYGSSTKMTDQICYIAPLKSSVNLGFNRGAEIPDPERLLVGTGKLLRHVKIKKAEDINQRIVDLLKAAAVKS